MKKYKVIMNNVWINFTLIKKICSPQGIFVQGKIFYYTAFKIFRINIHDLTTLQLFFFSFNILIDNSHSTDLCNTPLGVTVNCRFGNCTFSNKKLPMDGCQHRVDLVKGRFVH